MSKYDRPENIFTPYFVTVLSVTIISTLFGGYLQIAPASFPVKTILPVSIPIISSYWLTFVIGIQSGWIFLYVAIALLINSVLFLPVFFYTKFKSNIIFLSLQISIMGVYLLISVPAFKLYGMWMSV